MATIREIAKRSGFSQATVSRVLSDDPSFSVREATRQKILNASLEMGYENVPQYQRVTIPQNIALLDNTIPDKGLQDAYFDELRSSLRRHAKDERMSMSEYRALDELIADASKYAGFISIGPGTVRLRPTRSGADGPRCAGRADRRGEPPHRLHRRLRQHHG